MLEYDVNQVVASTMSCTYFLVSLKGAAGAGSDVLKRISGLGKWCIDLIRVPYYEQQGIKSIFCGVENDSYVIVNFESERGGGTPHML